MSLEELIEKAVQSVSSAETNAEKLEAVQNMEATKAVVNALLFNPDEMELLS